MPTNWVVIDCNYICNVAKYKLEGLSFQEKQTGIVFGFLRSLLEFSERLLSKNFIFCWDSNQSLRKCLYPEYKNKRNGNKTEEEKELDRIAHEQFQALKDYVLPTMGFRNVFEQEGYESDDIIASVVKTLKGYVCVVANDKDLYQLLDDCVIWNPAKKEFYGKENFRNEWGIDSSRWADVKAIAGCSTDCVAGVEGVKEITAIKFLKGELKKGGVSYNKIVSEEGKSIIQRNDPLVRLPFNGTRTFPIRIDEKISCSQFIRICEEYGFRSFLKDATLNKWYNNFGMWNA